MIDNLAPVGYRQHVTSRYLNNAENRSWEQKTKDSIIFKNLDIAPNYVNSLKPKSSYSGELTIRSWESEVVPSPVCIALKINFEFDFKV